MSPCVEEKQALKVTIYEGKSLRRGRGCGEFWGKRKGRWCQFSYNQGALFDKNNMECYHCHKLGHF